MNKKLILASLLTASLFPAAHAGPVVIDGTDSADHGSFSGSANLNGWLYMEKVLLNLAPQVGNGNKKISVLGIDGGTSTSAKNAIQSAFTQSGLSGSGWSIVYVDGTTAIANFFANSGANTLANTGILYIPTLNNVSGDITPAEQAVVNSNAAAIASFVGGAGNPSVGGGLFAQGQSDDASAFGWLTTLIPGIIYTDVGGGGIGTDITLTAAGSLAFPGLTNPQINGADPWHGYFSGNLGSLSVLGTALDGSTPRNIILGGGAGTVIDQNPVPEASTVVGALAIAGLCGATYVRSRRQAKA